jgi:MYXO-CTERM domain-containing protein
MKFVASGRAGFVAPVLGVAALALLAPVEARAQQSFTGKAGAITVTLTIPEGVTKARGFLAFTATGLGSGWGTNAEFAALAKRLNAGVVRVGGANEFGDATYPTRCQKGEFKWLLDALAAAAKAANHPELANAPIVGSGHSHGGDYWNYFNACYPERMALIFCKASGGVQYAKGSLRTPMIWEIGTNDLKDSRGVFRGAMMAHREAGTAMSLVLGPGETHGGFTDGSRTMVIDLMEAYFNLRVPAEVDTSEAPVQLVDIDEKSGKFLLGDNYTKEFTAFGSSPDKDSLSKTSFLPNEAVAAKWKAYGAQLPAGIMVEKGGHCTTCYKTPSDEPEAKPLNAGGPSTPPATMADAGAPGTGGQGGSSDPTPSGMADAGSTTSTTGGQSGGQGGSSGQGSQGGQGGGQASGQGGSVGNQGTGGSASPSSDPGPASGSGSVAGGCSVVPHATPVPAAALGLLMLALALRRRR